MISSVGIVGGAGYGAGELLRLLLLRSDITVAFVVSRSHAGRPLAAAHPDLEGYSSLLFSEAPDFDQPIDVLFLCSGHGESQLFMERESVPADVRIVDLSTDFRHRENSHIDSRSFLYGLPEFNRDKIRQADSIANPGCFATAITLGFLPLASQGLITDDLHVTAITGATGAGASLSATSHFPWRDGNVSVYKPFVHQHLREIEESRRAVDPEGDGAIRFVPVRGNFARGIHATLYTRCEESPETLGELYRDFYEDHPFTLVVNEPLDLKRVVNTNRCYLHVLRHDDLVMVTSIIDNLLKGAAGQACQNMNLMLDLPESTGLQLKATRF